MGVVTGARSLKSAVRKLEAAAAGRQKACAYCRHYREAWPLPEGRAPEPGEVATKRCEFCRAKLSIRLPIESPLHSFILGNCFLRSCEDLYTDRSANALSIWGTSMLAVIHIRLGFKKDREASKRHGRNLARERIESEYNRLGMRTHKRLRAKYGESFPEHKEIVDSVVNREREGVSQYLGLEGFAQLYQHETNFLICAEMERIVWG